MAGYNYTLRDLGDGYAMFEGAVNVLDYVMEDYMVLANYVQGFEDGVVEATNSPLAAKYPELKLDYSSLNGSGRIEIVATTENDTAPENDAATDTPTSPETGYGSNLVLWCSLTFVSGALILLLSKKRKVR